MGLPSPGDDGPRMTIGTHLLTSPSSSAVYVPRSAGHAVQKRQNPCPAAASILVVKQTTSFKEHESNMCSLLMSDKY